MKEFKYRKDIEDLGLLLYLADKFIGKAHILMSVNIGKSKPFSKKLENIENQICEIRSKIDNQIYELINVYIKADMHGAEINHIMYPNDNDARKFITEYLYKSTLLNKEIHEIDEGLKKSRKERRC